MESGPEEGARARVLEVNDLMAVSQSSPLLSALSQKKEIGSIRVSDRASAGSAASSRQGRDEAFALPLASAGVGNGTADAGSGAGGGGGSGGASGILFSKEDVVSHLAFISKAAPIVIHELTLDVRHSSSAWLSDLPELLKGHRIDSLTIIVARLGVEGGEALSELLAPPHSSLHTLSIDSKGSLLSSDEVAAVAEGLRSNKSLTHLTLHHCEDAEEARRTLQECAKASSWRKSPLVVNINVGDSSDASSTSASVTTSASDAIVSTISPPPPRSSRELEEEDEVDEEDEERRERSQGSGGGAGAGGGRSSATASPPKTFSSSSVVRPLIRFGSRGSSGHSRGASAGGQPSRPSSSTAVPAPAPSNGAGRRGGGVTTGSTATIDPEAPPASSAPQQRLLGRQDTGGGVD